MAQTKILFLAANPDTTTPLHAGREVRRIRERLASAAYGGSIEIVERWAVRPGDLQPALLEVRPQIVHFSGHGNDERELMLEGDSGSPQPVGKRVLGELFRLRGDDVRLVVLSACHSLLQAEAIAEHVDCAIGMRLSIGSEAATELSAALYYAIASGDSIQRAFESARLHVEALGIPEHRTPQLMVRRDGVDPARIVFTGPARPADVVLPFGASMTRPPGASAHPGGSPAGASAPELEFASITLDRRETCWKLVSSRLGTSPFSRDCRHYLQLDASIAKADLQLDVTVLNLASRPLMLTHVGIELVELSPSFDQLMGDDFLYSDTRCAPAARKVEKQDAYVIEGREIFRWLRAHVMGVMRRRNVRGGAAARGVSDVTDAGAALGDGEAGVVTAGEVVWMQLDDPIHIESSAPYRFGMIVLDVRQYLPRHLILRLTARTQLGDHHSSPIETCMSI